MKKTIIRHPGLSLVGLKTRTNNREEGDPSTAKIGPLAGEYHQQQVADRIPHRAHPGATICAYTDYISDHTGDYTFTIGEEVSHLDDVPGDLATLTLPPQTYAKFTTDPGPMPDVAIKAWQEIWAMTPADLGGARAYQADFTVHHRSDMETGDVVLDLYIGY